MLEKIEITQRFNFKKLNKHYECFIIDLLSKKAYFNINESKLLRLAKVGKDVGVELFVMDDGWFGHRDDDTSSL